MDTGPDASDTGLDGGDGGEVDTGPSCQLDELNTDVDRDDCDAFKYLNHGGDNVQEARRITEDEARRPNDSFLDAERNYDLQLPVQIDGTVGEVQDDGDLDHYAFTVDEPTAVLLHLEAKTSKFWPGAVFAGMENRNRNYRPQLAGAEVGENATRGVFLPSPGTYVFAVSDLRNLVSDQQRKDVGGSSDYKYRIHLSEVPLPKAEAVGVPGSTSHANDGRLFAQSVDSSELTGIEVTATGVSQNQQSAVNPSIALYDPTTGRTLGYTVRKQIDQQQRSVSLTTRLEKNYDELYVIDSYVSRFGETSTKVDVAAAEAASELETIQQPRDERGSGLTWLQPGVSVGG
ncbi:MAG: hypothetical protein ABEN55_22820, partial [Bradymonadaceae bacterium]